MILCVCRCAHLYTMFTFWFFSWILYWGKSFSESLEYNCWVNWKRTVNITLRFCPSKKSNKSWGDLERIILRISAPPELLPEFFLITSITGKSLIMKIFYPPKLKYITISLELLRQTIPKVKGNKYPELSTEGKTNLGLRPTEG